MIFKLSTGQGEVIITGEYDKISDEARKHLPPGIEEVLALYNKSQEIYQLQQSMLPPSPPSSASNTSC